MIIRRKFTTGLDDETGLFGWITTGIMGALPANGTLVAHDLMEHLVEAGCGLSSELCALGTLYYIRIENGLRPSNKALGHVWSTALIRNETTARLFDYIDNGDDPPAEPPAVTSLNLDCYMLEYLDDLTEEMTSLVRRAMDDVRSTFGNGLDIASQTQWQITDEDLLVRMVRWLKYGYGLAVHIYGPVGCHETGEVFMKIGAIAGRLLDQSNEQSGFSLDISIDTETKLITINHDIDEESLLPFGQEINHQIQFSAADL